jgi:predicted RNA-binding Zn-ribbon protein involved in translation (DUF1610 family)
MIENTDVAGWIQGRLNGEITREFKSMADFEIAISEQCKEAQRIALENTVQAAADQVRFVCPKCGERLMIKKRRVARSVTSSFGEIRFERDYGYCAQCNDHFAPADCKLGLHDRGTVSPRIQEICALAALRAPAAEAADDILCMTGIPVSPSTIHREARRQGERALMLRDLDEWLTQSNEGVVRLSAEAPDVPEHTTMIIEIDAWNIRERDNWGQSEEFRKANKDTGRWHWVFTGTVFRLDQRGTTASGRPVITERGYVATRRGLESFRNQLYAEALRRGMSKVETVLILADGAVWIWKLVEDRFKDAIQRLDLFHVQQHIWNLAAELYGKGTPEAAAWARPYIDGLESKAEGATELITGLNELSDRLEEFSEKQLEAIRKETAYLEKNKNRMDYKVGADLGQPVGSGAIESTCSQYQRRFKMTGQFWSLEGDEAFLALSTLQRNGRWRKLFPGSHVSRN